MDCRQAESLVTDYINRTMGLDELEAFITHVKGCPSCYDELQTYYTVYFAMEHLENEESNPSYNMNTVLLEDLKQRERFVKREKLKRGLPAILFALFVLALLLLLM